MYTHTYIDLITIGYVLNIRINKIGKVFTKHACTVRNIVLKIICKGAKRKLLSNNVNLYIVFHG